MTQIHDLEKIDNSGMHKTYNQWPIIAQKCYETDFEILDFLEIDHIVFSGMGGSGTIGDFFSSILSKTKIHTTVVKGYELPKTVDKNTLVIVSSVSGNTSETLSILKTAYDINCAVIAFSSGGKIQEFCQQKNIKFFKIQKYHSPRASFVAYSYSMLKILSKILPVKKIEIEESIELLNKISLIINSNNLSTTNIAFKIAEEISKIPVIIFPEGLKTAAIRFKNSLQENAKMHVMTEEVLEFCHNGIVSWEKSSNTIPILIQGKNDHYKTKERWKILKEYFYENNINYKEIISEDGSIISKLIGLIYILDYISIYRAILDNINPTPVKSIDFIKNKLN